MPTVSDMYIDEVGKQIVWSKQKEYSGQSFPEGRFLSHQQLNRIEFPSTLYDHEKITAREVPSVVEQT